MTINFNNLIVGRHESKILFLWNPKEEVAMLGAFLGIKDGIEAILARDGITHAQRAILEEFRAIADKHNLGFRDSQRIPIVSLVANRLNAPSYRGMKEDPNSAGQPPGPQTPNQPSKSTRRQGLASLH